MDELAIELESTEDAATIAREEIRARLTDRLPAPTLQDLLTVTTELVTNGVRYGQGDKVWVRLRLAADGAIAGEVENPGRGVVAPREIEFDSGGGLGLHIVAAIVDRWHVLDGETTRVRFELGPI